MWWYGKGNSGGSWLPEEKKANMWQGRGNSDGSWPPAFPRSMCLSMFNSRFNQFTLLKELKKRLNLTRGGREPRDAMSLRYADTSLPDLLGRPSLRYAVMSMRNTSKCACKIQVFLHLCFKYKIFYRLLNIEAGEVSQSFYQLA